MVIDTKGFQKLKEAFDVAKEKNLLLYDIMTERFEINTILQKEISMIPEIFGELEKGTRKILQSPKKVYTIFTNMFQAMY